MWHTMSSSSYPERPGAGIVNKLSCPKRILYEGVQVRLTSLRNSDLQMRAFAHTEITSWVSVWQDCTKKDSLMFVITAFMLLNLCLGQRFGSFTEKHNPMESSGESNKIHLILSLLTQELMCCFNNVLLQPSQSYNRCIHITVCDQSDILLTEIAVSHFWTLLWNIILKHSGYLLKLCMSPPCISPCIFTIYH